MPQGIFYFWLRAEVLVAAVLPRSFHGFVFHDIS
jgi:hypothetical protein